MTIDRYEMERLVGAGELIPLLCAAAELTGDRSLIADELRPNLQAEMITVPVAGGLSETATAEARRRIAEALTRHWSAGSDGAASTITPAELVDFMTDGDQQHSDLMQHELGLDEPLTWTKQDVAADRPFLVGLVGAGQAGLAMARDLRRRGIDFVMFEKAQKVGGTWRWNAYPGCRLDTSTLAYSYSFFQKTDWRHHFAVRESLERYFHDFAEREDILDAVRFGHSVERASWDEDAAEWNLTVRDVDQGTESTHRVHALISAVGFLNQPNIPNFDRLHDYTGETVHSAEWTPDVDYRGKRVNIIGTGASAYQIAPAIVDDVASLTVFQRSAPWMLPAALYHAEISEERQWLIDHLPSYHRWLRLWEFWHSTIGKYELTRADATWSEPGSVSEPNKRFRDALVDNVRSQYVGHESLLDSVIPTYPVGVKRMLRDNGVWARTLQQPQAALVTTPIDHFDENGIVTVDGQHHAADLTVFATGFFGTHYLGTMDVRGRDGISLQDFWGDESRAYRGINMPHFPNLFCLAGPNTGLVAIGSQTFMTESAIHYVGECLKYLLDTGATSIEPTEDAYDRYVKWVDEGNRGMAWAAVSEMSWYRNASGTNTVVWPYPLLTYFELTRHVDLEDMVVRDTSDRKVNA